MTTPLLLALTMPCLAAAPRDDARVHRSDVVFMGAKDAEIYDAYQATMVSWGGQAYADTEQAVAQFAARVELAHDRGMRYCAGLAFRTAFAGMIKFDPKFMDSVCRDLNGDPIVVPWLWDHSYEGHPAYWFCTNAPGYREYLRYQVRMATKTPIEGLHIDDYNGTAGTEWRGGCFCPWCMAAFRLYLARNVPAEKLKELDIESLDGFDYGAWLKGRGVDLDSYRKTVGGALPLGHEFMLFQYRAAAEWVGEIRAYAEQLVGHPLMLSVNSSASDPRSLVIAPQLTYFCGEVGREAQSGRVPGNPLFVYKVGDAIDRPMVCTSSGQDWAFIDAEQKPGLVRTWIAQAYAHGHQLMAPHRQWAYTQEKGTHWYQSQPSDYAPLYRFVREQEALLDGYDPVTSVGVIYSEAAPYNGQRAARQAVTDLTWLNVPCRVLLAGAEYLPYRLDTKELAELKAVVVSDPLNLDPEQQGRVDAVGAKVVKWPDEAALRRLVGAPIKVDGAEQITVVPRHVPGDATKPLVVHLLNRNYRLDSDDMAVQRDFSVFLGDEIAGGTVAAAVLHAPGKEAVTLKVERADGGIKFTVPELDLWAIVELRR